MAAGTNFTFSAAPLRRVRKIQFGILSPEQVRRMSVTQRVSLAPQNAIVEAGITDYWYRFTGLDGKIVGMTGFGASAPAGDLYKHFNITAEAVQAAVESVI